MATPAASSGSSAGCIVALVGMLLVLVVGGATAAYVLLGRGDYAASAPPDVAQSPDAPSPDSPGAKPATAQGPEGDYFAGAVEVQKAIAARFTAKADLLELVLYPGYAIFQLRDPVKRENVDRYTLRPTGMGEPDPERLSSSDKKELDQSTFALSDVDFVLVPKLVADAQKHLNFENGKVTHVIIDKFFPFRRALGFRVYVSSERDSGYVNYDAQGKLIKVQQ